MRNTVQVMTGDWPDVSYHRWSATCDTLHAHTQVLGKLAVRLAPPEPQLQHAALRLTARGRVTAPPPAPGSGALKLRAPKSTPPNTRPQNIWPGAVLCRYTTSPPTASHPPTRAH